MLFSIAAFKAFRIIKILKGIRQVELWVGPGRAFLLYLKDLFIFEILDLLFCPVGLAELLKGWELFSKARGEVGSVERLVKDLYLGLAQFFNKFIRNSIVTQGDLGHVEAWGRRVHRRSVVAELSLRKPSQLVVVLAFISGLMLEFLLEVAPLFLSTCRPLLNYVEPTLL